MHRPNASKLAATTRNRMQPSNVIVIDHPVVQTKLSELRDKLIASKDGYWSEQVDIQAQIDLIAGPC